MCHLAWLVATEIATAATAAATTSPEIASLRMIPPFPGRPARPCVPRRMYHSVAPDPGAREASRVRTLPDGELTLLLGVCAWGVGAGSAGTARRLRIAAGRVSIPVAPKPRSRRPRDDGLVGAVDGFERGPGRLETRHDVGICSVSAWS